MKSDTKIGEKKDAGSSFELPASHHAALKQSPEAFAGAQLPGTLQGGKVSVKQSAKGARVMVYFTAPPPGLATSGWGRNPMMGIFRKIVIS